MRVRYTVFGLLVSFAAVFFAGCPDVLSPPETAAAAGGYVLVVQIAGESPAGRTALPPVPAPVKYTISVTRSGAPLGSAAFTPPPGPYLVELTADPAAGDIVTVEGFNNVNVKIAAGSCTLESTHVSGETSVTVIVYPSQGGTGNVSLSVSLPAFTESDDDKITAAELSLYRSFEDYQAGNAYSFKRYRENTGDYGAGEDLGVSIPINYTGLPSGNYVVQIDFFRFKFVRVSRLVQTIVVRDGLTTESWDGGGNALTWGADKFASSNAKLGSLIIGAKTITLLPGEYSYAEGIPIEPTEPTEPTELDLSLTVTQSVPGQIITASLNGVPLTSGELKFEQAANSLAITVTAPDGVTKQTYVVSYTYYNETEWYVSADGEDSKSGTKAGEALKTVGAALTKIAAAYTGAWKAAETPIAARINISGEITENVTISDSALHTSYPPIILAGLAGSDKITADTSDTITDPKRPLTITNATVILEGDLTLTGGNAANGGGVCVTGSGSSFTMNGGTISGNTASGGGEGGGGVYIVDSNSFTMNGGTISGNTAANGGGVYVHGGSFTMNGGTISGGNTAANGGGVCVDFYTSGGNFVMTGGTISGNTANNNGGGVCAASSASSVKFVMDGGTISGNEGGHGGGGVYVTGSKSSFTMNGGEITGNNVSKSDGSKGGGGVAVADGGCVTMDGGTISNNTTATGVGVGGGAFVTGSTSKFIMNGGTITGNRASTSNGGGGVAVVAGGSEGGFTMNGGTISGNEGQHGGGAYIDGDGSTFTLVNGTISGNTSWQNDKPSGGVFAYQNGVFIMQGGAISGNTGWAVRFLPGSTFAMSGGTISGSTRGGVRAEGAFSMTGGSVSGNTENGVNVYAGGAFTMSGGSVSGNTGSGVYAEGSFTMEGGSISGNTTGGYGGGVYLAGSGAFTMSGGTISKNTINSYGGGVYLAGSGAFTMSGGSISGNTTKSSGGGVYFAGNGAFTMSEGSISGNTTNSYGGGVYFAGKGAFTMSGGTISGNTVNISGSGGGVYVCSGNGSFKMEGSALISQDNDVWLAYDKTISIAALLTATPYAARITPQAYTAKVLDLTAVPDSNSNTKFTVTPPPYGFDNWTIDSGGFLQQNY